MDWSEPYLKLEHSHKSLKDALNQERYEDAYVLICKLQSESHSLNKLIQGKVIKAVTIEL